MSDEHSIHRVRIELQLPSRRELYLRERCSELFRQHVKEVLDHVCSEVDTSSSLLFLPEPLVVDLGELPMFEFDKVFTNRLIHSFKMVLRQVLLQALSNIGGSLNSQTAAQSFKEPQKTKGQSQESHVKEHSLLELSQRCLIAPDTFTSHNMARLCQQWTYDVPLQGEYTQETALLSALYYRYRVATTQQHLPSPPKEVPLSFTSHADKALMAELFTIKRLHRLQNQEPAMHLWFQLLWKKSKQRPGVLPHLDIKEKRRIECYLDNFGRESKSNLSKDASNTNVASSSSSFEKESVSGGGRKYIEVESEDAVFSLTGHASALEVERYNVGSCLLWPFLPGLFRKLGFVRGGQFLHEEARDEALTALITLLYGESVGLSPEQFLIPKFLCGYAPTDTHTITVLDESVLDMITHWWDGLSSVLPDTWKKLSVEDIRWWFLHRSGTIKRGEAGIHIYVEPEAYDVFLQDWNWPIHLVSLSWLDTMINVDWAT
ncbi:contractile injection system tape measure protein (plasmid) [Vibrio cyclitrophicus]|uniref:contractile injection system tape measure protein n=3 Tax=Vibrio TaxID=662 RepID=UPI001056B5B2|nr:contractile injection system tape measure protein [Vibrio cyclitrophicus]